MKIKVFMRFGRKKESLVPPQRRLRSLSILSRKLSGSDFLLTQHLWSVSKQVSASWLTSPSLSCLALTSLFLLASCLLFFCLLLMCLFFLLRHLWVCPWCISVCCIGTHKHTHTQTILKIKTFIFNQNFIKPEIRAK